MSVYFATAGDYVKIGYSADPIARDMQRMSAMAVLMADRHRGLTRDEIAATGIRVEAAPLGEVAKALDFLALGSNAASP